MKRMICFISGQLLPNFIPVNEQKTRPDVLHAVYTPSNPAMVRNWQRLRSTIEEAYPNIRFEETPIENEYDSIKIKTECEGLLRDHPSDDWSLNATGGTKLMSSPAIDVFAKAHRPVYYVETPKNRMLSVQSDWNANSIPFESEISIETYFSLFGKYAEGGSVRTGQEKTVYGSLSKLDWTVWPSVSLYDLDKDGNQIRMAEFDAIGVKHYQLYAVECKRLTLTRDRVTSGRVSEQQLQRAKDDILIDLYKLAQVRQHFGGPFGKSYWVFSGKTELSGVNRKRIEDFGINLIQGKDINLIAKSPEKFGLPPARLKV
jgi:hypothetical protein